MYITLTMNIILKNFNNAYYNSYVGLHYTKADIILINYCCND